MPPSLLRAAILVLPLLYTGAAHAQQPVEQGRFVLHKLQQRVGEERYAVVRDGRALVLHDTSSLSFLGGAVPLTAELRMGADLTPQRLAVAGATSTMTRVSAWVEVAGGTATVREAGAAERRAPVPERFFAISHYPPMALEQALFRYWQRHGRPARLPIFPAGEVRITPRGRDTAHAAAGPVPLERFMVRGLVWGMQTAWVDAEGRLVAAVSGDAELDRFEAVREGFEAALPLFVRRSVEDGLAELARVADEVRPVFQDGYAIAGARLVDGTGRPPVDDAVVLVRGGRIAAVGPRGSVIVPPGTPVVQAEGATLLPGLWDMHGHYEQVEWPAAALAAGITTVRDVANEFELVTALREGIASGRAVGPRMLAAGVIDGGEHPLGVVTAATPEEARAAVRRYHAAGFEQVKVYGSVPPALVPVIAAEAHALGMTVTGHVPEGMDALAFVRAGADQINHVGYVAAVMRPPAGPGQPPRPVDPASDEASRAIRLFLERGTVIDPSLARGEEYLHVRGDYHRHEPGVLKAPPELRGALQSTGVDTALAERAAASLGRTLALVGALHAAGVPIVLGTDLSVPGHSIHRELELAVRAGLSPMQAIQAATLVPARAMGLEHDSGTVEVGKRADLLVVSGDPLADISATRRVRWVVTGGRLYDPRPLWEAAGFQP